MRGSGWLPAGGALVLWIAAVGYPALAVGGVVVLSDGSPAQGGAQMEPAHQTLLRSVAWALAVAMGAVVVGWAPGRLLGRSLRARWYPALAALMLAPICLPAYVIFYAWWQSWPADSALFRWAVETDLQTAKRLTLLLGFLCWSWPLVAWCVAGSAAARPARRDEMLCLDGAGGLRRLVDGFLGDGRGLAMGALIVFLCVLNNTTSFTIAGELTVGYELMALDALRAGPAALVKRAAVPIAIAGAGVAVIWLLLGGTPATAPGRPRRAGRRILIAVAAIWLFSTVVPMSLFGRSLGSQVDAATFVRFYGRDLVNTLTVACASGLLGMVVAVGLASSWQDRRRWVRVGAHVQALGWLLAALVPGTIVGLAFEAAYNRPGLDDVIYTRPTVLILAYLARYAFVGALLGRWLSLREPAALADIRRLDGAETLKGLVESSWPRLLAAAGAAFAIVSVLSMSDLSVTGRLQPAGFGAIATDVLDAVHYQRPRVVLMATFWLIFAGVAAGVLGVGLSWPLRALWASRAALIIGCVAACSGAGCVPDDPDNVAPLPVRRTFGSTGLSPGQFSYPRGIAVDRQRRLVYVVDKTARVQRFGFDGRQQGQWRMPQRENGKPVGLGVAPDGSVFVADTHYHRVIRYDSEGNELLRFGSYGKGPGQFIYPTDVAFGPDQRIYVSEYGGNERIQVFSAQGEYLFGFGSFGSGAGQFNRPQAMVFNAALTELYVADACNHRIVVCDPQGRQLRVLGRPGRGAGELAYPYDVTMLDDGSLLVCEFGNNRIQHLASDGECRGLLGRVGAAVGELKYPWGIDAGGDWVFVLDSGNNRVQVIRPPR
ncbi:MAG: SMP-30/gluconolactonase/LRE family protein [Planctomycetes bacterium]|nr:SMP-30/gluconolactonase/LRE family protein [Planctomycetota bacterium]